MKTRIDTAKIFKVNRHTITRWINAGKLNLINNKISEDSITTLLNSNFTNLNKHYWNYNYFKEENEEVAYWAGFLMADGSIREMKNNLGHFQLSLAIAEPDYQHIIKFCRSIELDIKYIKLYKNKPSFYQNKIIQPKHKLCRIDICDSNLGPDLLKWGIIPNKTHNFIEPTFDLKYFGDYLRGWIDGDGSIRLHSSQSKNSGPQIQLIGQPDAIEWLGQTLINIGYNSHYTICKKQRNKVIYFSGFKNSSIIYHLTHGRNNLRLHRKWYKLDFLNKE